MRDDQLEGEGGELEVRAGSPICPVLILSLWLQVVVDQGVARTEEEEGHYQTPKLSRLQHLARLISTLPDTDCAWLKTYLNCSYRSYLAKHLSTLAY